MSDPGVNTRGAVERRKSVTSAGPRFHPASFWRHDVAQTVGGFFSRVPRAHSSSALRAWYALL